MRNLAIIIIIAACLLSCGHNSTMQQAKSTNQGNLRFEKNRLIVSAMLADSTAMEFEFDSGCVNGYANIDSATLERVSKLQTQPNTSN